MTGMRAALDAAEWERQTQILTPDVGDDWMDVSDLHQARCDGVLDATPDSPRWDCERPLGHFGEHVASIRSHVAATWTNASPQADAAADQDPPPPFEPERASDAVRELHGHLTSALAATQHWSAERADLLDRLGKAQYDLAAAVDTMRRQAERITELEREVNGLNQRG